MHGAYTNALSGRASTSTKTSVTTGNQERVRKMIKLYSDRAVLMFTGRGSGIFEQVMPPTEDASRDYQLSKVYSAEGFAEAVCPSKIITSPMCGLLGAVSSFLTKATESESIARLVGRCEVEVSLRPNHAKRSDACCGQMRLAPRDGVISSYEVLHELAHALQRNRTPHHGETFATLYLLLVSLVMSHTNYLALKQGFEEFNVKYDKEYFND